VNHHGGMGPSSMEVLGYLFHGGDRPKTDLPYRETPGEKDDWLHLRNEEAVTTEAIVQVTETAHARYGFNDSS
jgi:glucarate dehydratase